ncbi:MAG: hypothetical protein ACE5IK_08040, partial [Acidobacteriota bacterium]
RGPAAGLSAPGTGAGSGQVASILRYQDRPVDPVQAGGELAVEAVRRVPVPWGYNLITLCHIQLENLDEAARAVDRMVRELQTRPAVHSLQGLIAACSSETEEARRQVARTVENEKAYGHYHHAQYDIACIHALTGRPRRAVDWLRRAAGNGYPCFSFFSRDRLLDSVRDDDGFVRLMKALEGEQEGYRRLQSELSSSV